MAGQTPEQEIASIRHRLGELDDERERLVSRLEQLQRSQPSLPAAELPQLASLTGSSSVAEKVALFRRLFAGRLDVFPARWENKKTGRSGYAPACSNEWVRGVCGKPQVKCGECPNQAFIPVSDGVVECHLRGDDRIRPNTRGQDFVLGVYPLLFDDTCRFLAVDFDGENWALDGLAFLGTCRLHHAPAYLTVTLGQRRSHLDILLRADCCIAGTQARYAARDEDYG